MVSARRGSARAALYAAEVPLSGVRSSTVPTATASAPAVRTSRTCSALDTPPVAQIGAPVSVPIRRTSSGSGTCSAGMPGVVVAECRHHRSRRTPVAVADPDVELLARHRRVDRCGRAGLG
jgi:hypothetical protein